MSYKYKYLFALLLYGAFHACPALASADMECDAFRHSTNLKNDHYDPCTGVPFLSPRNDSTLNLQWLLIDSGRLTGQVAPSQSAQDPESADPPVPFSLAMWQVQAPTAHAVESGKTNNTNIISIPNQSQTASDNYADGEGSRCRSASEGAQAFQDALKAAHAVPADEAATLAAARLALAPNCQLKVAPSWSTPANIHSTLGLQFATYIAGANAFYGGDFALALKNFALLTNSADPWLRETARYMIGRTQLNAAQAPALQEWGYLDLNNVDKKALDAAEAEFQAYLHDFPQGRYAASANGLLRRVYVFENNSVKLAAAYDQAFAPNSAFKLNITLPTLIQETTQHILTAQNAGAIHSPALLATLDLTLMRANSSDRLRLSDLHAQKARFANQPELYNYLLAAFYFYVDKNAEQTLALLPPPPNTPLNYLAFSQQTLRGFAMEASGHTAQAQQLWLQLLPLAKQPLQREQLELALAMNLERAGQIEQVFKADSPITDPAIRALLLEHSASAALLRQQAKTNTVPMVRDAALYTLLYKELTQGKYEAFHADLALLPAQPSPALAPFGQPGGKNNAGYTCTSLREAAATLQQHPNESKSLLCIGEWARNNDVHYDQDRTLAANELGGSPSPFPNVAYSRMDSYLKIIANRHADSDARAYAFYRAIYCFAPAGNNTCGDQSIPKTTRKHWFTTLQSTYPNSVWAKTLKHYW